MLAATFIGLALAAYALGYCHSWRDFKLERERLAAKLRAVEVEERRLLRLTRMVGVASQVQTDIRRLRRYSIRELEQRASAAPPGGGGWQ
jgi:hypothetical protein